MIAQKMNIDSIISLKRNFYCRIRIFLKNYLAGLEIYNGKMLTGINQPISGLKEGAEDYGL
jgi:hypothetical protein